MPTGYTATLYEGKDQTFPEFALECARAFGAMVTLRDEPNAAIPERFGPSGYHDEALGAAYKRFREVRGWTPEEADAEADAAYMEQLKRYREARAKRAALKERYDAMLAQVEVWEPPTSEHQGLKDFMAEQLRESIRFDCGFSLAEPERQTGEQYRKAQMAAAERDIAYHKKEGRREDERAEERTEWVRELRASLEAVHA